MLNKYVYECPSEKGFKRIKVKKSVRKQILKHSKQSVFRKHVWWISGDIVEIHHYISFTGKVCILFLFPVIGIVSGFLNMDVYDDYKRLLFQKRYGSFSTTRLYLQKHPEYYKLLGLEDREIAHGNNNQRIGCSYRNREDIGNIQLDEEQP